MADYDEKKGILGALVVTAGLILLLVIVARIMKPSNPLIMNCMPIMGNEVEGTMPKEKKEGEGFAPVTPYFDVTTMTPKTDVTSPEWAQKYGEATDGLLGQNFVDNADPRKYTMTHSTCGRRFMSLDLRRVPVPTRDPTTVTSFGLPYIPPDCVRYWQNSRPSLDC